MTTRSTKAPEAFISSKVALDPGEPDLIRAIQFTFGLDDNDVAAWGLMWLFRWAREDPRVLATIAARDAAVEEHGPSVPEMYEALAAPAPAEADADAA